MGYLTDHRAEVRDDPRQSARLRPVHHLRGQALPDALAAFHPFPRRRLRLDLALRLGRRLPRCPAPRPRAPRCLAPRAAAGAVYESRICVDTAPLLERSYARLAGLGWIGRNTCLINQQQGSWFFLGELLVSLEIAPDAPPPDRCGTCMRCVDACPTAAILPGQGLDATPLHLLLHHRAARRNPRGAPRRNRRARLRLRHLPGRLPLERARARDRRSRLRAPPLRPAAGRAGGHRRRRIPRHVPRHPRHCAPATRASCATSPSPWATPATRKIPSPPRKTRRIPRPPSRRTTPAGP